MKKGLLHIIGICGIGMSAIAQHFNYLDWQVQGSDSGGDKKMASFLNSFGITVFSGHSAKNIQSATLVVKSNAIKGENEELQAAQNLSKTILTRAEALKKILTDKKVIAISGCHGKTTTTAMIAEIFLEAGLNPNIICGGIINSLKNNTKCTKSELFIVEADESDNTFLELNVNLAVVTNIEADHLEFHINLENICKKFGSFIANSRYAIIPMESKLEWQNDKAKIYDFCNNDEAKLQNVQNKCWQTSFQYQINSKIHDFLLNASGMHNVKNAMAAISAATEYGIEISTIKQALAKFSGVDRRLTHVGKFQNNLVIDDYAHHPTEIAASIKTVTKINSNLVAIIQPHRYRRVRNFFHQYLNVLNLAKYTILLPTYSAGEEFDLQHNSEILHKKCLEIGARNLFLINNFAALQAKIIELNMNDGVILCMGAGDITAYAYNLIK